MITYKGSSEQEKQQKDLLLLPMTTINQTNQSLSPSLQKTIEQHKVTTNTLESIQSKNSSEQMVHQNLFIEENKSTPYEDFINAVQRYLPKCYNSHSIDHLTLKSLQQILYNC